MSSHPLSRPILGASSSGSGVDLAGDLLEGARRRLGVASLVYVAAFSLAYVFPRLTGAWGTAEFDRSISDAVAATSIVSALLLAVLSRLRLLATPKVLSIGLWFLPLSCYGIAVTELWGAYSWSLETQRIINWQGISWTCIWMVVFAALVPTSLIKASLSQLAAATAAPLTMLFTHEQFAGLIPDPNLGGLLFGASLSSGICAGMAIAVSQILYRLGRQVTEARQLGAYRLADQLGHGGMGEVWRAEHRFLARPAAVKLVRSDYFGSKGGSSATQILRRFEREAQATAGLRCPHTVNLYDFGVAPDGTFYYVMELLDGINLEDLVERFGPVPAGRAVHVLRQVCESLEEAHERGLLHRDIKPANVFCCRYGLAYDFVKVLDFGLVKTVSEVGTGETKLTAENTLPGTPAYMAPEAILGEEDLTGSVDIYAVGCVAYWLLTGRLVFEASSPMRLAVMHVERTPAPPSTLSEIPIPEALDAVIMSCLAKAPHERPDAATLKADLEALGLPPWSHDHARDWWQRHMPAPEERPDQSRLSPSSAAAL